MIEKMKFLSITGPKADIDRVVDTYLSRYEIHLENALSELKTVKDLRPYIETNPYKEKLNIARELAEKIGGQLPEVSETELPTQEEAAKLIGVSVDTLGNYERGKSYPDVPVLRKIEDVYGVPYEQLIFLPLDYDKTVNII